MYLELPSHYTYTNSWNGCTCVSLDRVRGKEKETQWKWIEFPLNVRRLVLRISVAHQKWLCLQIRPPLIQYSTTGSFVRLHNCLTKALPWRQQTSGRLAGSSHGSTTANSHTPPHVLHSARQGLKPTPTKSLSFWLIRNILRIQHPQPNLLLSYDFAITGRCQREQGGSGNILVCTASEVYMTFCWSDTTKRNFYLTLAVFYTTLLHKLRKRANY